MLSHEIFYINFALECLSSIIISKGRPNFPRDPVKHAVKRFLNRFPPLDSFRCISPFSLNLIMWKRSGVRLCSNTPCLSTPSSYAFDHKRGKGKREGHGGLPASGCIKFLKHTGKVCVGSKKKHLFARSLHR